MEKKEVVERKPREVLPLADGSEPSIHKGDFSLGEIEILREVKVFENRFAALFEDDVIFPSGAVGTFVRFSWRKREGAAVLPILPDGSIVLIEQFRHATRSWSIEAPRGFGEPGESPEEAALREMAEETGFRDADLVDLGRVVPDPGMSGNGVRLFLAYCRGTQGSLDLEETEAHRRRIFVPKGEVAGILDSDRIFDLMSRALLLEYLRMSG